MPFTGPCTWDVGPDGTPHRLAWFIYGFFPPEYHYNYQYVLFMTDEEEQRREDEFRRKIEADMADTFYELVHWMTRSQYSNF
jgi:hypothetical protein